MTVKRARPFAARLGFADYPNRALAASGNAKCTLTGGRGKIEVSRASKQIDRGHDAADKDQPRQRNPKP